MASGSARELFPPVDARPPRRRDAAQTRQELLEAARRRFARDGYAASTVRDIANDVGVNVTLINRYFESKVGLFEACLDEAVEELTRVAGDAEGLEEVPEVVIELTTGPSDERPNLDILLLLRGSNDPHAEELRVGVLKMLSERLAEAAGWRPGRPGADEILLRSQLFLAVSIGITVLRASPGVAPIDSASGESLVPPLRDVVGALLSTQD